MGDHKGFTVVLRGYDRAEVDALLERIHQALASTSQALRASVRGEVERSKLRMTMRGYDRVEVDEYLRRAVDHLS